MSSPADNAEWVDLGAESVPPSMVGVGSTAPMEPGATPKISSHGGNDVTFSARLENVSSGFPLFSETTQDAREEANNSGSTFADRLLQCIQRKC